MDRPMIANYRLGFVSAAALVFVGIAYLVVGGLGVGQAGLEAPIADPILAAMELITLVSAPLIVVLLAVVYQTASQDRKTLALVGFSFGLLMAGLTSGVHFVTLTSGRQTDFTVLEWPSTLYALELLAWDFFLGLAFLFAAPALVGTGLRRRARWSLATTGALCLLGTVGPLTGDMALQRIGILGYGFVLPVAAVFLALMFHRGEGIPAPTEKAPEGIVVD